MSGYIENYKKWVSSDKVDEDIKKELILIKDNDSEIESRFCSMLEFGTAGLRGVIGAGLNRMNKYIIRYTTQALCNLIAQRGPDAMKRGVCIAYDSRLFSDQFAKEAARVLAANNIKAYLFDDIRPTPELSFCIRFKNAIAGINITASHNPKEYNGYKVYWEDGAQLSPQNADIMALEFSRLDIFEDVKLTDYQGAKDGGLIEIIGAQIDKEFLAAVKNEAVDLKWVKKVCDDFKIIYTPLHGAGYKLVLKIFEMIGVKNIIKVEEQMIPDGNFSTVTSPNPESGEAFELGIKLAQKEGGDLIIATDPDCDRMGIALKNKQGQYVTLTGNQIGVLLADYIIKGLKRTKKMPKNPILIKTIVSSDMVNAIADKNNIKIIDVLTGFKFIGEKIKEFEKDKSFNFIFGYEESHGYLKGTYCRDKDAVVASMLAAEMACYYKAKNMTLFDAMESLYKEYGYFLDHVINIKKDGPNAIKIMKETMQRLRDNPPLEIGGFDVIAKRDYLSGEVAVYGQKGAKKTNLPKSNVLYYELSDNSKFIIRPSGTEPKIKVYFLINGESEHECNSKLEKFKASFSLHIK